MLINLRYDFKIWFQGELLYCDVVPYCGCTVNYCGTMPRWWFSKYFILMSFKIRQSLYNVYITMPGWWLLLIWVLKLLHEVDIFIISMLITVVKTHLMANPTMCDTRP